MFVHKTQAQFTEEERGNPALGDQYVFVANDAETKLIPAFLASKRNGQTGLQFLIALQKQLAQDGRIPPTIDGLLAYRDALESTFGAEIALHFSHSNILRVYCTLRVTAVIEARITDHVWMWGALLMSVVLPPRGRINT
jgi:hypothetical protein